MLEILLSITAILLLFGVAVLLFVIRNLIIQNRTYEQWVINFSERVEDTYQEMKRLDEKEMFEKDDEVGVVFTDIHSLLTDLNKKRGENEDESEES